MGDAQKNLDEAKAKGAETYASELYLKAEASMVEARNLIAEKDYEKGKEAAEAASQLARQSTVLAETTKMGLKEEAERMIGEAEEGIVSIQAWSPPKNMKKRLKKLRGENETRSGAWGSDLAIARACLAEEKIREAHVLAGRILGEVSARIKELDAAAAKSNRKRP
jgi:hypothetical protein